MREQERYVSPRLTAHVISAMEEHLEVEVSTQDDLDVSHVEHISILIQEQEAQGHTEEALSSLCQLRNQLIGIFSEIFHRADPSLNLGMIYDTLEYELLNPTRSQLYSFKSLSNLRKRVRERSENRRKRNLREQYLHTSLQNVSHLCGNQFVDQLECKERLEHIATLISQTYSTERVSTRRVELFCRLVTPQLSGEQN